jgi:MFS family permease
MSFPAATLILSNAVEKRHQGVAMSIINTLVNYSISIALGFAGTIEVNVSGGGMTKDLELRGYRGALYFGVGLAGMGLIVSLAFLAKSYHRDAAERKQLKRESEKEKA